MPVILGIYYDGEHEITVDINKILKFRDLKHLSDRLFEPV
jgi:hypothetical protein